MPRRRQHANYVRSVPRSNDGVPGVHCFRTALRDVRCGAVWPVLTPRSDMIPVLILVEPFRSTPRETKPPMCRAWQSVERRCQNATVVGNGHSERWAERRASSVWDEMALRTRLAPIRRFRPHCFAPFSGLSSLSRADRDEPSAFAF